MILSSFILLIFNYGYVLVTPAVDALPLAMPPSDSELELDSIELFLTCPSMKTDLVGSVLYTNLETLLLLCCLKTSFLMFIKAVFGSFLG